MGILILVDKRATVTLDVQLTDFFGFKPQKNLLF